MQVGEFGEQLFEVAEDQLVADADAFAVLFAVHLFDVEQNIVEVRSGFLEGIPRDTAARFNGGLDAAMTGLPEQREGNVGVHEGLAAGKGHAAAGAGIEQGVLLHFLKDLIDGLVFAVDDHALCGTGVGTVERLADVALAAVERERAIFVDGDGVVFTGFDATVAADAAALVVGDLRMRGLGFGVTAPFARQGAALQEDDGPDAGTVVNGIFLNIEDGSGRLSIFKGTHGLPLFLSVRVGNGGPDNSGPPFI